jgi:ABC-type spermidine/putrescine transport system permease subunit I
MRRHARRGGRATDRIGRRRRRAATASGIELLYPRGFWALLAAPGLLWILAFFVVAFYAIIATATSTRLSLLQTVIPEWNPLYWQPDSFSYVAHQVVSSSGLFQPVFVRTITYVAVTVGACVLLGYPVAYYMSRLRGRVRTTFLVLMVLPFWVSFLMRILAWVNLLQPDGLVNRIVDATGVLAPQRWLEGRASTVIFGLIYGYIPFFILPLYATLERMDKSLVQAALDLGASPARAFWRVTLPLSKHGILAGITIIMLPMFGDFYTADLLGTANNSMIGSVVNFYLTRSTTGASQGRGAALVVVLAAVVSVLTFYYLVNTARAAKEARRCASRSRRQSA